MQIVIKKGERGFSRPGIQREQSKVETRYVLFSSSVLLFHDASRSFFATCIFTLFPSLGAREKSIKKYGELKKSRSSLQLSHSLI